MATKVDLHRASIARAGREALLYECDEGSWIEASVARECRAELDTVASVVDRQSSEAYS